MHIGADNRVGELRDLAHHAGQHLLLVGADRGRELGGRFIPHRTGQVLERGIGRDLECLGRARILRVLQHLLLATAAPQQVKGHLGQRERLRQRVLRPAHRGLERVATRAEIGHTAIDATCVIAGLAQMLLQRGAIAPPRGHRDLRLEHLHQPKL